MGSRKNSIWAMPPAALEAIKQERRERLAFVSSCLFFLSFALGRPLRKPGRFLGPLAISSSPPSALLPACHAAEAALHGQATCRSSCEHVPCIRRSCTPPGTSLLETEQMMATASRGTRFELMGGGGGGVRTASESVAGLSWAPRRRHLGTFRTPLWPSNRPAENGHDDGLPRSASPASDRTPSPHGSETPPCARAVGRQAGWWTPSLGLLLALLLALCFSLSIYTETRFGRLQGRGDNLPLKTS